MDIHVLENRDIVRVMPLIEDEWKEIRSLRLSLVADPTKRFDPLSLKAYIAESNHLCYAVELGGEMVAFCLAEILLPPNTKLFGTKKTLVIRDLYVTLEHRRHKIGEALVRSLLVKADEAGCVDLHLDLRKENKGAIAFAEALGLVPLSFQYGMEI